MNLTRNKLRKLILETLKEARYTDQTAARYGQAGAFGGGMLGTIPAPVAVATAPVGAYLGEKIGTMIANYRGFKTGPVPANDPLHPANLFEFAQAAEFNLQRIEQNIRENGGFENKIVYSVDDFDILENPDTALLVVIIKKLGLADPSPIVSKAVNFVSKIPVIGPMLT